MCALNVYEGIVMKQAKRRSLERAGWRIGDASSFLGLSEEEAAYIEMKLLLAEKLRSMRRAQKMSQAKLAQTMGSSQSRVAKMEAGDPTVSVDLMLKGLLALGADRRQIAKALSSSTKAAA